MGEYYKKKEVAIEKQKLISLWMVRFYFTLWSLNDNSQRKELQSNTKKPGNQLFQLPDWRFFCPQVVNVIVKLFAHRHLVRSRIDIP
jgi:hypothetical protein